MKKQIFNWQRFWYPRGTSINLWDEGFPAPPRPGDARYNPNPNLVPFRDLAHSPCLILLGEPGMGKSHVLNAEFQNIEAEAKAVGNEALYFNLGGFASDSQLVAEVFKCPEFQAWTEGTHTLHLFLDSLDEGQLRIQTVTQTLVRQLKRCDRKRLALRIVCRAAEWPAYLEDELRQLWRADEAAPMAENAVQVFLLAPLLQQDVIEAAATSGIDPDSFLMAVREREVIALAMKPITLKFLLNSMKQEGQLPATQRELHERGCRILCEDLDETGTRPPRDLDPDQRLAIAGRIAALTIFSNRPVISLDKDPSILVDLPGQVRVRSLAGQWEEAGEIPFSVSDANIRETLDTGLFIRVGAQTMRWAHQTYAEFLAAWYLQQHNVTPAQIMNLLVHPEDEGQKIIPQLHEVAARLATLMHAVFQTIVRSDPEVLLRSDVANADPADRRALIQELLELYDRNEAPGDIATFYYLRLKHPGLAEQLRPYIQDRTKSETARREAIEIALICEEPEVQEDLVACAMDQTESVILRTCAARALAAYGDPQLKARLKPLALGDTGADLKDELKGWGLYACWPECLSAEELFSVLVALKKDDFSGTYARFLRSDPIRFLKPADLPLALDWLRRQRATHELQLRGLSHIAENILACSWEHLTEPGILRPFVTVALIRLEEFEPELGRLIASDEDKRQEMRDVILDSAALLRSSFTLVWSGIIKEADVPLLLTQLTTTDEELQERLAALIAQFVHIGSPYLTEIVEAAQQYPALGRELHWLLQPIELTSPEAQEQKRRYYLYSAPQKEPDEELTLDPPLAERIARRLLAIEDGNMAAWWHLNWELELKFVTFPPRSYWAHDEMESDLTATQGWREADTAIRIRITEAAKQYILRGNPETEEWLGKTQYSHRPALAGFRALRLLLQMEPSFLDELPGEIWAKWAASILDYPTDSQTGGQDEQKQLVCKAYAAAPEVVLDALLQIIDYENRTHGHLFVAAQLGSCWDDRLAETLLAKCKDPALSRNAFIELLSDLFKYGYLRSEVKWFAGSLIPTPPPQEAREREWALIAGRQLLLNADDAGWPTIWLAIQADTAYGRKLVEQTVHVQNQTISTRLTVRQNADLYLWLMHEYPPTQRESKKRGTITARYLIGRWQESIPPYLEQLGTLEAIEALEDLRQELPEQESLTWRVLHARAAYHARTWVPLAAPVLLALCLEPDARSIQSESQLQTVVLESLRRFNVALHGTPGLVHHVWNEEARRNGTEYKPKDENRLSDEAVLYLQQDLRVRGIVVNREVEIRRGEETDIHIDTFIRAGNGRQDRVSVIVETKGCWHPDVLSAMETQLVNRYLKDNKCQHGIYLVGWFLCDKWYQQDRKTKCARAADDSADLQNKLDTQATGFGGRPDVKALVLDCTLR